MIELDVQARREALVTRGAEPARFLVLGDFGGHAAEPLAVDRDNIDHVLARCDVSIAGTRLRELGDFHPDQLYRRMELFRSLQAPAPGEPALPEPGQPKPPDIAELIRPSSLLERIAEGGDPFEQYLRELTRAHAAPRPAADPRSTDAIAETMRELLHHPRFQTIEAAWRGIDFAVRACEDEAARIHIAQFSKKDLARDLLAATELKSTRTYEFFHSRPWHAVLGLHAFGESADDIELLGRIALIAAHARAPFLAEGAVDICSSPHWEELRSIPEASYLGLALPRFLLRLPYGARTNSVESFPFEEMPGAPVHSHYLWGSPAFACLGLLAREEGELDLQNLPIHSYQEAGEWKMTPCAEVYMTDAQVLTLMDQGLMPLVSYQGSDRVRLSGFRAINSSALPIFRS